MTRRAAALIIMLVSINSPTFSWAEQLTLPCKFEGSERLGAEREKDVNQIYVDTDIQLLSSAWRRRWEQPPQSISAFAIGKPRE